MGTVWAPWALPPDPFMAHAPPSAARPTDLCLSHSIRLFAKGPPTDAESRNCRPASTSFLIRSMQPTVDQTKEFECLADGFGSFASILFLAPSLIHPFPPLVFPSPSVYVSLQLPSYASFLVSSQTAFR